MVSQFENTGARVIGERPVAIAHCQRTLVVLGVGRGGTSAVAGALSHLGIFMGEHACKPTFEDHAVYQPMEAGDVDSCQAVIDRYSDEYRVWGYKRGSIAEYLRSYHGRFVNPIYVVVFRDLAAIAHRAEISGGSDYLDILEQQQRQYGKIVDFLSTERPYALVLSYEKILARPDLLVQSLIEFAGLNVSPANREKAASFIEPSPKAYLRGTRIERAEGALTHAAGKSVRGWARYAHRSDYPVVELLINGVLVAEAIAKRRLKEAGKGQAQRVGFAFRTRRGLRPGDQIRVRVKGEAFDLDSSPYTMHGKAPQRAIGHLDSCEHGLIKGWARYVANEDPAVVDIYRNGARVAECTADRVRADLELVSPEGRCAFELRLDGLEAGDLIQAKVQGEELPLQNSPLRLA